MRNQLIKLFNDNRRPTASSAGCRIVNAEGDEATVYLYDAIGGWYGVGAADFVKEMAAITAPVIRLRINSPGGDVFEARAMATAIRNHSSKVIAQIDGLAASAATYIALAADEVEIADGGFFMIHRAWTLAYGNAGELRDTAELLDKIDGTIRADYQRKTNQTVDQIDAWMEAETWFTAQEALDYGFVDRIGASANVENHWNLSAYAKAPKALTERQPVREPVFDHAAMELRLGMLERC